MLTLMAMKSKLPKHAKVQFLLATLTYISDVTVVTST